MPTNNHESTRVVGFPNNQKDQAKKGDLSEKSEACMHDHTWLRPALPKTSPTFYPAPQPTATPTPWCGNEKNT